MCLHIHFIENDVTRAGDLTVKHFISPQKIFLNKYYYCKKLPTSLSLFLPLKLVVYNQNTNWIEFFNIKYVLSYEHEFSSNIFQQNAEHFQAEWRIFYLVFHILKEQDYFLHDLTIIVKVMQEFIVRSLRPNIVVIFLEFRIERILLEWFLYFKNH